MNHKISANLWDHIICPHCGGSLKKSNKRATCTKCQSYYKYTFSDAIDFRLQQQKTYHYDFTLGLPLRKDLDFDFHILQKNNTPEVKFSTHHFAYNLTKEIISYFPKAKNEKSLMLDLGAGNMKHQEVCEHAGFEHVGLDYESDQALMLGDAHALPFKDESFEFILSVAVIEHIKFPCVMMKEAYRVLKPNGLFIGTVAFLEPFHDNSFYHHTHLGIYNSLNEGGFKIEKICPNNKWTGLMAQACMGLFPRMPRFISKSLIFPIHILHKIWWRIGNIFSKNATEKIRIINNTAAFIFIARKQQNL